MLFSSFLYPILDETFCSAFNLLHQSFIRCQAVIKLKCTHSWLQEPRNWWNCYVLRSLWYSKSFQTCFQFCRHCFQLDFRMPSFITTSPWTLHYLSDKPLAGKNGFNLLTLGQQDQSRDHFLHAGATQCCGNFKP